jgi:hypothetical protein
MATDTPKRLYGPASLTDTAATLYTAPGGTDVAIVDIHVCNETSSTATLTLSIGTDGSGKRLYKDTPIAANSFHQRIGNQYLAAGEVIQAYSGTNAALTITISGIETA